MASRPFTKVHPLASNGSNNSLRSASVNLPWENFNKKIDKIRIWENHIQQVVKVINTKSQHTYNNFANI